MEPGIDVYTSLRRVLVVSIMTTVFVSSLASAETATVEAAADDDELRFGIGARVGGYGFRDAGEEGAHWERCRMDGLGLFGTLDLNRYFFTELGAEFYAAVDDVVSDGTDRESFHLTGAFGVRMLPDSFISPYAQIGVGAELTRVTLLPYDVTSTDLFPTAFIGVGGEINLTDHIKLGAHLRMYAMALPDDSYTVSSDDDTSVRCGNYGCLSPGDALRSEEVEYSFRPAGQGQFFVRYAF